MWEENHPVRVKVFLRFLTIGDVRMSLCGKMMTKVMILHVKVFHHLIIANLSQNATVIMRFPNTHQIWVIFQSRSGWQIANLLLNAHHLIKLRKLVFSTLNEKFFKKNQECFI